MARWTPWPANRVRTVRMYQGRCICGWASDIVEYPRRSEVEQAKRTHIAQHRAGTAQAPYSWAWHDKSLEWRLSTASGRVVATVSAELIDHLPPSGAELLKRRLGTVPPPVEAILISGSET